MEPHMNQNNIKFTPPPISLPLFMVSRNRIKYLKLDELKTTIRKNIYLYNKDTNKEFETATLENYHHILGLKKCLPSIRDNQNSKVLANSRNKVLEKSYHLAPNCYNTNKIPYESRRGLNGAYWPKEHIRHVSNIRRTSENFLSIPTTFADRIFSPCQRAKGVFLSNARERRATSRCMVSNIVTCYKNPFEPGPTAYNPSDKTYNKIHNSKKPNPHLFYRLSIVPVKKNNIHSPHTSFTPAPGRYETRYSNICPCSSKFQYQPQIDLIIEKEKRHKFRRLNYNRIKSKLFTSPDWNHVKGRGFRYLFKGAKPTKPIKFSLKDSKKTKSMQLFPDSKYIWMINNPQRTPLSGLITQIVTSQLPIIKFNCITKKITRKQLKNNKKIVFNSTQERFRTSFRLPILTQKQQEQIKQNLPPERQLRDHPIMGKEPTDIKSKLNKTPKHMLPNYVPKLRKKIFKFLPLPQAKILVTENDTNIKEDSKGGFYLKTLEPKKFFKDSAEVEQI